MGATVVAGFAAKHYVKLDDLVALVETAFANLPDQEDVTSWMDLIRTCRQPQVMWEVDYIEPKKQLFRINELIKKSEDILFVSPDSIELKEQYNADVNQLEAFNTVRVHLKAEQGDFETALKMIEAMLTEYYRLSVIRQSNLLYHACLIFLCCKKLELSYQCLDQHWGLLKYADPTDRVQLGLWDNQILMHMAYWFFIKHSDDVRDFYSIKTQVPINEIWNHKKIAALYFFEYDNSWIVSFCGLPFYQHARSLYPNLPAYEKKRSTPHNIDKVWASETSHNYDGETEAVGEERYYFEQFNREMSVELNFADHDKASDYLYSYYHYQTDYVRDINGKVQLVDFMKRHIALDDVSSILEAGTGIDRPPPFVHQHYLGLNISSKVCTILRDKGIPHKQGCASILIGNIDEQFDLCLAYDFLNHLTSTRLRMFMEECSKKCKYLLAAVDTESDCRRDILSKRISIDHIDLHPTVMTMEEWQNYLLPYFDCSYEQVGKWIHIFGKQKT